MRSARTARSAIGRLSTCRIAVTHPARHRENRPETLPSGGPKIGSRSTGRKLYPPPVQRLGADQQAGNSTLWRSKDWERRNAQADSTQNRRSFRGSGHARCRGYRRCGGQARDRPHGLDRHAPHSAGRSAQPVPVRWRVHELAFESRPPGHPRRHGILRSPVRGQLGHVAIARCRSLSFEEGASAGRRKHVSWSGTRIE
jgi:hypothetical protein